MRIKGFLKFLRHLHIGKRMTPEQSMVRIKSLPCPNVLYHSDNFLCVDKQYDIKINSDEPDEITIEHQVRQKFPELVDPKCKHGFRFCHRLDYATSGILCLGLNKNAAKHMSYNFKHRTVVKYYLALVRGHLADKKVLINVATGDLVDKEWPGRRCAANNEHCDDPRDTTTLLVCLERGTYDLQPATKVLLKAITGRQHQLRVHCDYIGHTIVGDYTYSLRQDKNPPRMMLHAHRLVTDTILERLDLTSPDPFTSETLPDWKASEEYMTYTDAEDYASKFDPENISVETKNVFLNCEGSESCIDT